VARPRGERARPRRSPRSRTDDARVARPQRLIAHAEAVQDAGAEGLQHDVGALGELEERLLARRLLQVEADRALVAVEREEPHGLRGVLDARRRGHRPADVVAHPRVLDLDDVGAVVREQQRAERAGQQPREVQDAHALQREAHAIADPRRDAEQGAGLLDGGRAAPESSVMRRARAIRSPFEEAIVPSGR
jgi:hypothetical protein